MEIPISRPSIEELAKVRKGNTSTLKQNQVEEKSKVREAIKALKDLTEFQLQTFNPDYAITHGIEEDPVIETLKRELEEFEEWLR